MGPTDVGISTAVDFQALANVNAANDAFGYQALFNLTDGATNVGPLAGTDLTSGDNNIYIGNTGDVSESDTIRIGQRGQTRTFIAGINGVHQGSPKTVFINTITGQLGTMSSSRRFKKEIKPMDSASEAILALKPVTFHYKSDAGGTPQFGLNEFLKEHRKGEQQDRKIEGLEATVAKLESVLEE